MRPVSADARAAQARELIESDAPAAGFGAALGRSRGKGRRVEARQRARIEAADPTAREAPTALLNLRHEAQGAGPASGLLGARTGHAVDGRALTVRGARVAGSDAETTRLAAGGSTPWGTDEARRTGVKGAQRAGRGAEGLAGADTPGEDPNRGARPFELSPTADSARESPEAQKGQRPMSPRGLADQSPVSDRLDGADARAADQRPADVAFDRPLTRGPGAEATELQGRNETARPFPSRAAHELLPGTRNAGAPATTPVESAHEAVTEAVRSVSDHLVARAGAAEATVRLATPEAGTDSRSEAAPPVEAASSSASKAAPAAASSSSEHQAQSEHGTNGGGGEAAFVAPATLESRSVGESQPTVPEAPRLSPEQVASLGHEIEALYVREGRLGRDLKVELGELGSVRVQVQQQSDGRLEVTLEATHPEAIRALQEARGALESRLADRGYAETRVAVRGEQSTASFDKQPEQQRQPAEHQDHAAILESLRSHHHARRHPASAFSTHTAPNGAFRGTA